ncbi:glycosyltransferase [Allokutzneria oryzae]|uniref:Glycosyltransferase n=1 Tax=Allokutzneria oryzae TaxID=1378989 RepID=A0ABV5ZRA3_9PSEU
MRVLIFTAGSRGDTQPYLGLAEALGKAGHDAVLAVSTRSLGYAEHSGVRLARLRQGPVPVSDSRDLRTVMEGSTYATMKLFRTARRTARPMFEDAWRIASEGADLVVHNPFAIVGSHIAEALGVPSVPAPLVPVWLPTKEFPCPYVPGRLPRALNWLSYGVTIVPVLSLARATDAWREELGLPRRRARHNPLRLPDGSPAPVLNAFSGHVVPVPTDWPDRTHTTGYWFSSVTPGWQPARELTTFLDAGPPPVYIGFGSMVGRDPRRLTSAVLDAIRLAGVRAVVATGWGGLRPHELPPEVLMVDEVPHDWLFPQMAAIVHHGGAGTVAAATAAGRPQVVCPFFADQPYWGRRLHALGVAAEPLGQRRLTARSLASAIRSVLGDPSTATRAARLGEAVSAEDGAQAAVAVLERLA